MWPRTAEVMLGLWLAASPFIFGHRPDDAWSWWTDLMSALLTIVIALLSFRRRTARAHLLNITVALWLIGQGYTRHMYPAPPAAQNEIITGLLLLMLAIIPGRPERPPDGWLRHRDAGGGAAGTDH